MPIKRIVFALGLIIAGLNSVPASAQTVAPCANRTEVIQQLNNQYSETRVSIGLTNEGAILEMFVSKDKTFSIVVTQPSGISCLVASGGNLEILNTVLAGFKI